MAEYVRSAEKSKENVLDFKESQTHKILFMIHGSRSGFMKKLKLHLHNNESLFVWRREYALGCCVNCTHFVVSCFHLILLFHFNTQ